MGKTFRAKVKWYDEPEEKHSNKRKKTAKWNRNDRKSKRKIEEGQPQDMDWSDPDWDA